MNALAFVQEDLQSALRVFRQCFAVAFSIPVKRSVVRNEGRLIHHDGQTPIQGEVGFHVCVTIGRQSCAGPPFRLESGFDQSSIALLALQTATAGVFHTSQNTVTLMNRLLSQRPQREHLSAKFFERTTVP